MSAVVFTPIESRPPPVATQGALAWVKRNFFDGWLNTLATLVTVAILLWTVAYLFASMHAVYGGRWSGTILRGLVVTGVYAVLFVVAVVSLLLAAILLRQVCMSRNASISATTSSRMSSSSRWW